MTATLDRPTLLGREQPRLMTAPLRPLTPDTTRGYEAIAFAEDVLGVDLLPWQRWWLLHALELKADGSYRFRTVLTLVGRQQGKTTLLKIVCLWALYMGHAQLILGAAQSLDIARESWQGAVELAQDNLELSAEIARNGVRIANGSICLTLNSGARYRITAATRSAGRGLSVDLLVLDEIREQRDWAAWGALSKTTLARPNALIVGISNAGDDQSVVLNSLRSAALAGTDDTLGIFEWSAPDGCALDDVDAWAQACPGLGRTITESAIRSALATDPPAVFRTELLCQRVDALETAVDSIAWKSCADRNATLAEYRKQMAVAIDVAPDGKHVSAVGAAPVGDGRVRIQMLGAWDSTTAARAALPTLFEALRPRAVGWFPSGPAAVLGAELAEMHAVTIGRQNVQRTEMLEHSPGVVELTGLDVTGACQTLADLVEQHQVLHPDDPLLNAHVVGSQRQTSGDGWRFMRRGGGHVDAAYAASGAVHLARTLPAVSPAPRSQVF